VKKEGKNYLRFFVGSEGYAFDIHQVNEVLRMVILKKIPGLPGFVRGVFNLRGQVVIVIDLRERFGVKKYRNHRDMRIIVTEVEKKKTGFIVDSVSSIVEVMDKEISPVSECSVKINDEFITCILRTDEQVIPVLNIGEILSIEERVNLVNIEENLKR